MKNRSFLITTLAIKNNEKIYSDLICKSEKMSEKTIEQVKLKLKKELNCQKVIIKNIFELESD